MKRTPIELPGKSNGFLTKYLLPEKAKQRLDSVCPSRGRSRWIGEAIDAFSLYEAQQRNLLLLDDQRLRRGKLEHVSVRLSQIAQRQLKEVLVAFRREYPGEDLEISGVFRAAVIFHLRRHEGLTISGKP